jgi:hypothetical protein
MRLVWEIREVQPVVTDVYFFRNRRKDIGKVFGQIFPVKSAAGDDLIGVEKFLLQINRRVVKVGPGVKPNREWNRPIEQTVKCVGTSRGVVSPVGKNVIVVITVILRPRPRLGQDVGRFRQWSNPVPGRRAACCSHIS